MNNILLASIVAWAIAQMAKTFVVLVRKKSFDFRYFVNGGMPSSHSATVSALATSVAVVEGVNSTAFGIAVILALMVMYDAASVRRWVGRQSMVLNRLLQEIRERRPRGEWEQDLREFVGHTPFQVIIGAALGITVALLWFSFIA